MIQILPREPDKDGLCDEAIVNCQGGLSDAMPPYLTGSVATPVPATRALDRYHALSLIVKVALGIKVGEVDGLTTTLAGDRPIFNVVPETKVAQSPTPEGRQYKRLKGESAIWGLLFVFLVCISGALLGDDALALALLCAHKWKVFLCLGVVRRGHVALAEMQGVSFPLRLERAEPVA